MIKVEMKHGVIYILFFFISYSYLCECRNSAWHHRSIAHDTYDKHPPSRINRSFDDIGEDTDRFDDVANSWRVNIFNPKAVGSNTNAKSIKRATIHKEHDRKRDSESSIQENITLHSHTTVIPEVTGSHHLTNNTTVTSTRHSNKSKTGPTTSTPTTKLTKKTAVNLLTTAATSSTSHKKHSNMDIHKEINNQRLKVAIFNIESEFKELKEIILELENAQRTTTIGSTTPFTGDTTIGVQTTPKPFPGEYQGYIPVTKAVPSTMSPSPDNVLTRKHQRATRRIKNGHNHRMVHRNHKRNHHHMRREQLKKKKRLDKLNEINHAETPNIAKNLTEGMAELHHHVAITQSLNRINENIVTGLLGVKHNLIALSGHIKKALHEIGNEAFDNTNEERTDIKVNSDKIAQLQQGLEGKIDDLRYNITSFITSQQELAKSMTWSLEKMVVMLSQMVDKITDSDSKLHTEQHTSAIVTRPESTTKPTHTDTKEHITQTSVLSEKGSTNGQSLSADMTTHPTQFIVTTREPMEKERGDKIEAVFKEHQTKNKPHQNARKHIHEGKPRKQKKLQHSRHRKNHSDHGKSRHHSKKHHHSNKHHHGKKHHHDKKHHHSRN